MNILLTALLGAERDFKVWTYNLDNSTQTHLSRQFYLCWLKLVWFEFIRFWQNVMANFCICEFAVWEALASLKQCAEVIHSIELKQSYCEILESVPAVFATLSWIFQQSLSSCSALAGNRQYITGLSIHYPDMTCFDGLYLKKSWSAYRVLWQNIDIFKLFGLNRAQLCALWLSTLHTASRSY